MSAAETTAAAKKPQLDFRCLTDDCDGVVGFDLESASAPDFQAVCPVCHRAYALDETLRGKLEKMMKLIASIRECEEILGDSVVSVNVAGGEVRVPYALLLTRLNTMISLDVAGRKTDFHLWVEPSNPQVFR